LQPGTTYYWEVHGRSATQFGNWSSIYSFTVGGAQVYDTAFLTDAQLVDSATLTVSQIRDFLSSKGSYFANTVSDVDGVSIDLSTLIAQAAAQYQINPQVLLTTLQKESVGVTTSTRPSDARMALLMGAGSPSTARGQIARAAQLFRSYQDDLAAGGTTVSGWKAGVAKTTLDGVVVTPATNAVAGQFTYTPYAGAQWGGNQPAFGGVYLFYFWWKQFGFDSSPAVAWTGGVSGNWYTPANWSGGSVPSASDIVALPGGARQTITATSISISGPGSVDLGSAELLLSAGDPATFKGYLAQAYDASGNQDWSKAGLTSSFARGNPVTYSVGYAYGGDQSAEDAGVSTHGGAPLTASQLDVRAVLTGDSNMDGRVDFFDIVQVLGYKYNTGQAASFTDGDLDYNGNVNFFDIVTLLSANYNTGQTFGPAPAAAAPEALVFPSDGPAAPAQTRTTQVAALTVPGRATLVPWWASKRRTRVWDG
jgi:hypothetical protein